MIVCVNVFIISKDFAREGEGDEEMSGGSWRKNSGCLNESDCLR